MASKELDKVDEASVPCSNISKLDSPKCGAIWCTPTCKRRNGKSMVYPSTQRLHFIVVCPFDLAQDEFTEFELSSQDHGEVLPLVFLISIADPYVPPIIKKNPETMTKLLKATMAYHLLVLGLCQLSYSHMAPIGWKHMRVPKSAPMSETSGPKTGIALAIMYEMIVTPAVQLIHTAQ